MARDDLFTMLAPKKALGNTANAAINTGADGEIIDLSGETGGAFLIVVDGLSAGTVTAKLIAGDEANLSDGAEVTMDELVQVSAPLDGAPGTLKVGYAGIKRYVRVRLEGAGATGASAYGIYASCPTHRGAPLA